MLRFLNVYCILVEEKGGYPMENNIFGKRLKQALEYRQMRAVDLARKTGLTRGIISSYINGRWKAKQTNVMLIARALHVSESWLMGYDVRMEPDADSLTSTLSPDETQLLSLYRTLDDANKKAVLDFVRFKNLDNEK